MAEKKFEQIFDCLATRPYAEDDELLNDYVEEIIRNVMWKAFRNQEEICSRFVSKNNPPKLAEDVDVILRNYVNREFDWLAHYIIARILIAYRIENIDLGEDGEWFLRDYLGDELYDEFEVAARKYIYQDYEYHLGKEKADEYFRRIGREDYIVKE